MAPKARSIAPGREYKFETSRFSKIPQEILDEILKCLLEEKEPISGYTVLDKSCPHLLKINTLGKAYPALHAQALGIFYAANAFEFVVGEPLSQLMPTLNKVEEFKKKLKQIGDALSTDDHDVKLHTSVRITWTNQYWSMSADEVDKLMRLQCDIPWDMELVISIPGSEDIEIDLYALGDNFEHIAKELGHKLRPQLPRPSRRERGRSMRVSYKTGPIRYRNFAELHRVAEEKIEAIRDELQVASLANRMATEDKEERATRSRPSKRRKQAEEEADEETGEHLKDSALSVRSKAQEEVATDESDEEAVPKKNRNKTAAAKKFNKGGKKNK